jgi:quinohemoprotein ethanol dehydrogenase
MGIFKGATNLSLFRKCATSGGPNEFVQLSSVIKCLADEDSVRPVLRELATVRGAKRTLMSWEWNVCMSIGMLIVAVGSGRAASATPVGPHGYGQVDEARLLHADREPDQWFTPGRDAQGTYYSPLKTINEATVSHLGFAWEYNLGTRRGLEATPVVVDGVMYTSGNWGRVYALDAASGRELWTYDPGVPGQWGRYACCDTVNRGVAVLDGRVYVASIDGYLHALDAKTGRRAWRTDTLPGRGPNDFHFASTGAPLIAGDLIIIGSSGSDFAGARGSVSAYDRHTGVFKWRLYTVPRDPRLGPQDQPHLEAAIKTWDRHYNWAFGGGGAVWDGMAYDPKLHLVYVGTGNASPYGLVDVDHGTGHDELYGASILAIHLDSGLLAWHYQEVPGDGWDYDSTAKMVMTDLTIGGQSRQVVMQASKNGFLYVLDRRTGEFLSAEPFAHVNWTKGLDPKTHRPITAPEANWMHEPKLIYPATTGAHGWQPMSYSPKTGLVYVPVIDAPNVYVNTEHLPAGLIEGNFNVGWYLSEDYDPKALEGLLGKVPTLEQLAPGAKQPMRSRGFVRAVEPATGKLVWEQEGSYAWDGGVLSTAGNLVFHGDAAGFLNVFAADSGRVLARIDVGTSIMAAPMTYRVNGVQYVAVMAGYGGGLLYQPFPPDSAAYKYGNAGRIVAFKLDGAVVPKPPAMSEEIFPPPPPREGTPTQIKQGEVLYNRFCSRCHTFGRGLLPDLRHMAPVTHRVFSEIVLKGAYQFKGMARWDDVLTPPDVEAIHAYLVDQSWQIQPDTATSAGSPKR